MLLSLYFRSLFTVTSSLSSLNINQVLQIEKNKSFFAAKISNPHECEANSNLFREPRASAAEITQRQQNKYLLNKLPTVAETIVYYNSFEEHPAGNTPSLPFSPPLSPSNGDIMTTAWMHDMWAHCKLWFGLYIGPNQFTLVAAICSVLEFATSSNWQSISDVVFYYELIHS